MTLDAGPSEFTRLAANERQTEALIRAESERHELWRHMQLGLPFFEGSLIDRMFRKKNETPSDVAEYPPHGETEDSSFRVRAWLGRAANSDTVRLYTQSVEKGSIFGSGDEGEGDNTVNWRDVGDPVLRAYTRGSDVVFVTADGDLPPKIFRLLPPSQQSQIIGDHRETVDKIRETEQARLMSRRTAANKPLTERGHGRGLRSKDSSRVAATAIPASGHPVDGRTEERLGPSGTVTILDDKDERNDQARASRHRQGGVDGGQSSPELLRPSSEAEIGDPAQPGIMGRDQTAPGNLA